MSVKKIDLNKYKVSVELGTDLFGKRRRKFVTVNGSKADAIKIESELVREYYHIGKKVKINDLTFKQLSQVYLKDHCKHNASKITINLYESYLDRINDIIGNIKIKDITPFMLNKLYEKLRKGKRSEISNRTLLNYYKLVNAIFRQALRWDLITKNPNEKIDKPKKERNDKAIYNTFEVKQLLNALDKEPIKFRTLIVLTLDSGARRGEICGLRWSDIDFDTRIMEINRSLKVIKGKPDETNAKTLSSIRKIVLSETTIKLLIEYKKWQDEYIKNHNDKWVGKEDRVFTSLTGRFMNPVSCDTILSSVIQRHGLKKITYHGLRHTCASLLINSGVDIRTVSDRLGHANCSMTLDVYTHVIEESKAVCANKFDELVESG